MNCTSPNSSISGAKALNASYSPLQHQHQQTQTNSSASSDSSSRRASHQSSSSHATARNNQSYKKQHKSSRKAKLVGEDAMAESGAMRNANSRRGQTSITHLMNFTLPPRPQDYRNTIARGSRRGNVYGIGSGHHSTDKARYIHANYRFIVKPNGDYKSQAANADQHLDWNDVLQILASSVSQEASCPICLSPPVAPRMAKCGHIFCLPCLIRYMHSTDDSNPIPEKKARWKKCPICWDSVYQSETRPVRWYAGQEQPPSREGDDVVLRLVMRQPGSTLALPRDGADALGKAEDVPWYFAAEVMDYARIMKGSEEYMKEQYDNEVADLKRQENEDELMFGEEPEWTRKAVNAVNDAKERIQGIGDPPPVPKQPAEKKPKRQPIKFNPIQSDAPEMYFIQHASKSGINVSFDIPGSSSPGTVSTDQQAAAPDGPSNIGHPATDDQKPPTTHPKLAYPRSLAEPHNHDSPYFFYQALLHYYLAPLDIRILKSAFGRFASFPSTLLPRVEHVSTGHIMDDELRKRTKYLSHLPYGCEVGFLECNWTDVVAPEILDQFKTEIEKRRKRNREKEYREEKDRLRAEKVEDDERWENARRKRPAIPTETLAEEEFHPLASSSLDASNASPPWPARQGSSFASLASPSTSPSGQRTVWGTTKITPTSPDLHPQPENETDDGWLHAWEQELAAEDELIAQVQAASLNGEASDSVKPPTITSAQQGKKKKKKITLMSTNVRRGA